MKIDEGCINHNAVQMVLELVGTIYDCSDSNDDMDHIRIATLGEIKGICEMAKVMKEVLKA